MADHFSSHDFTQGWRERMPRRRLFLRTAGALLVALLAFSSTVALLTRAQRQKPREVVTAQLQALGAGDVTRAYFYFSESYRAGVTLDEFRHLVAMHRTLFRTRQVDFARDAVSGDRALLELRITTLDGNDYPVEYRLLRENGLWRIEDFRYHVAPGSAGSPQARI